MISGKPSILFSTPDLVRESFVTAHTSESIVTRAAARVQEESPRALGRDMTLSNLVRFKDVTTPVLVLGGEKDGSYSHAGACDRPCVSHRMSTTHSADWAAAHPHRSWLR
jgi:hypothetical protein